jgi:hypothetical protein
LFHPDPAYFAGAGAKPNKRANHSVTRALVPLDVRRWPILQIKIRAIERATVIFR